MAQPTPSVYVIAAPEISPGRVKIGHTSRHPYQRLADLQTGSPTRLQLIFWTEGNESTEQLLHALFSLRRVHGEWFDFGEADPVAEISEAVRLMREAVEPYDPHRCVELPAAEGGTERTYEDRCNAIIATLIAKGPAGTRQVSRLIGLAESSTRRVRDRMRAEGILSVGLPDRHGGPEPLILNESHPAVTALLP